MQRPSSLSRWCLGLSLLPCVALAALACSTSGPTRQPTGDGHAAEQPDEQPDEGEGEGDAGKPSDKRPPGPELPSGSLCDTNADCGGGQICEGIGCEPGRGRCVPAERICTRDLATYCGCDGQTFKASGSCPNARYAYRGPCTPDLEDGEPCTDGRQCRSGQCVGEGLEGCTNGAQGECGSIDCTADLAAYCSCNNTEFQTSSLCPNRQFAYRGPCEGG